MESRGSSSSEVTQMRHVLPAIFVGCAVTLAGCASGRPAAAPATVVTTVFVTVAPSPVPSPTASSAAPRSAAPVPTAPAATAPPSAVGPPAPVVPSPRATLSASAVVGAYYAAINAGDYRTAWNLGGDNLDDSYQHYVSGFSGTANDTISITGVEGDTVSVVLDALQSDGSDRTYAGTYTVSGGQITGASIAAVGGATGGGGGGGGGAPNGVILAPNGDHYRAGEYCPDKDADLTTVDGDGHTIVCVLESGRYHWH